MYSKQIFLLSFMWLSLTNGESTYPSIVWNPWNPLFACDEPKIHVRIGDIVNFVCPSDEFTYYVPSSSVTLPYENLYFLGSNKEQYEACNATGMTKLLNCNGIDPKHKTLTFRDSPIARNSILFAKGETYYFIGTGFRTKDNLENSVNGSCMITDKRGVYKLRLQVYVCTDDDAGCHICTTAGCYYKDCGTTKCSNWTSDGIVYKNSSHCFKVETRSCTNILIGDNNNQTRYADAHCSSESDICSDWVSTGNLYYDATSLQCFSMETRTCNSTVSGENYNENKYTNVSCPNILKTCPNVTTRYLSSNKCDVLPSRYCHVTFGGKVKETNYTPCAAHISFLIEPSMTLYNTSAMVSSSKIESAVPFINSTNITLNNTNSTVNVTSNKVWSGSSIKMTSARLEPEYGRQLGRDISEKDTIIHGLAVAVALAFIIGVTFGALTVKYMNNKKCTVKVENKVQPGITTFSNSGFEGTYDNSGKDDV